MGQPTELVRIDRALDWAADESDDDLFDELVEFLQNRLAGEDRPLPVHVYRLKYAETLIVRHSLSDDRGMLRVQVLIAMVSESDARLELLGRLAALAGQQYDRTHQQELVTVADTISQLALAETEDGSEGQAKVLLNLANIYRQSSWHTDSADDAERAIHFARKALAATQPGTGFHEEALFNLCNALLLHAEHSRDPASLDEGITVSLQLLGTATPQFWAWHDTLLNVRQAMLARTQSPMPLGVDWTDAYRALLERRPAEDELEVEVRFLAAGLLAHSASFRRDLTSMDVAITGLRATSGRLPDDSRLASLHQRTLREALTARAELTGDTSDLAETGPRDTEPLTDDETIEMATALIRLGENTGDAGALTEAVTMLEHVLPTLSDPDDGRITVLNMLCMALRFRSELTRSLDEVSRAIAYGEQAAELAAADLGMRAFLAVCLLNLGTAYRDRHDLTDDPADLELAVQRLRTSIMVTPSGDGGLAMRLSNLSHVLTTRYNKLHAATDMNEAIVLTDQALRLTPPGTLDYARYAGNLCADLLVRAGTKHDDGADLERAYAAGRTAVEATPPGHPLRGLHLINLSAALMADYRLTRDPEQLEEALRFAREAVDESAPGDPRQPLYLSGVRSSLLRRYELAGNDTDLREAVALARRAVALSRPGTGLRANYDYALAEALARSEDAIDLREAAVLLSGIAESESASVARRFDAAKMWGWTLQRAEAEAADIFRAYRIGTALLPLMAWRGVGRTDREALLAEETGLASRAAGFAMAAGLPEEAVEVLELGRGVLWSQLLDLRSDLDALHEAYPDQARRLEALRSAIESTG